MLLSMTENAIDSRARSLNKAFEMLKDCVIRLSEEARNGYGCREPLSLEESSECRNMMIGSMISGLDSTDLRPMGALYHAGSNDLTDYVWSIQQLVETLEEINSPMVNGYSHTSCNPLPELVARLTGSVIDEILSEIVSPYFRQSTT